jgi:methionine synthase II (cobalamin-independent)
MPLTYHLYPPFRAEHVGSLIRPTELHQKRQQYESNAASEEELREAEENAIKVVVKLQKDLGIKTITDGEMTR